MKLRPLGNRILVKVFESAEKSTGGIILPETAKEVSAVGVVEEVGSGNLLSSGDVKELDVKKGNKVIFLKHAGQDLKFQGAEYKVLREADVLAVQEG